MVYILPTQKAASRNLARFIPDVRVKPASLHGEYRSRPASGNRPALGYLQHVT